MSQCRECEGDIVWARTLPNRAMMPLNPERRPRNDETANVAVHRDHLGSVYARVLKAGEQLETFEWRAVAHFATCPARAAKRAAAAEGAVILPFAKPARR